MLTIDTLDGLPDDQMVCYGYQGPNAVQSTVIGIDDQIPKWTIKIQVSPGTFEKIKDAVLKMGVVRVQ